MILFEILPNIARWKCIKMRARAVCASVKLSSSTVLLAAFDPDSKLVAFDLHEMSGCIGTTPCQSTAKCSQFDAPSRPGRAMSVICHGALVFCPVSL